jgi:hypothetical protein
MNYAFVAGSLGAATLVVAAQLFYMPRFKLFATELAAADPRTWDAVGRPDGSMLGSARTPLWSWRLAKFLWRRKYDALGVETLRIAGDRFRTAFLVAPLAIVAWLAVTAIAGSLAP